MNEYLIQLIVKSSAVLLLGALTAAALWRSPSSARYMVWTLTIAAIVALPLAVIAVPAWRVAIGSPPAIDAGAITASTSDSPLPPARETAAKPVAAIIDATKSIQSSGSIPSEATLLLLWVAGSLLVIARMCAGGYSLSRVVRRAIPLTSADWTEVIESEKRRLGMHRNIAMFASDRVSSPLTTGIASPVILLPADRESWSREHRHIVLRHEVAHIARGDTLVCLLSGLACALYWFNPLVWLATRRLRTEQERSCDDRVIVLGTSAPDYAAHLLEVARSARNVGMHSFVSVAMARPSQLEGRLLAVLRKRRRDPLTRRRGIIATAAAAAALAVLSALHPVRAESAIIIASQAESPNFKALSPEMPPPAPVKEKKTLVQPKEERADSVVDGEVAVSSGGTLELDLKTGAGVRIVGSDENRVRMHAELGGRDWRNTIVTIDNDGSGARIATDYRSHDGTTSSSHRMLITVPRKFNVHIQSAGGEVVVRDVDGTFSGSTGGGEINIEGARGTAHLTTGGGPVSVKNSQLSGSVSTGGGSVLIQGVTGGLRGSSGTGDVFYGASASSGTGVSYSEASSNGARVGSDGRVYVRKSGGSVDLDDVANGASIQTGGGAITIGASAGDVDASTGAGDVTAGPLSRGGHISTGAGDVKVSVAGSGGYPIKVESGNGTVTLILPPSFSGTLDLETAFTNNRRNPTRIESDWPVSTTVSPDWDAREGTPRRYVRAHLSLGSGGATVRVKTVNGNIIVKRR